MFVNTYGLFGTVPLRILELYSMNHLLNTSNFIQLCSKKKWSLLQLNQFGGAAK
jgi:hypothetical protein